MGVGSPRTREARFWKYVDKTSTCWIWRGTLVGKYGQLDKIGAHRFSYELHHGPIPKGLFVCHRCDNPRCVNPAHLFLGTPKDNTHDMLNKGRHVRGERVCTARLTREQVGEIRRLYAAGATQVDLAARFGVGQPHISAIVRGAAWKDAS